MNQAFEKLLGLRADVEARWTNWLLETRIARSLSRRMEAYWKH